MKTHLNRLVVPVVAGLIISCLLSCAQKHVLDQPADSTLSATLENFNAAYQACDAVTLEQMLTVAYRHTNGGTATMNSQDWLKLIRLRGDEIADNNLVISKYAMTGISIDYYEHVAVVTGTIEIDETQRGNKEVSSYRTTQVWAREGSVWKRAAYQDARIH